MTLYSKINPHPDGCWLCFQDSRVPDKDQTPAVMSQIGRGFKIKIVGFEIPPAGPVNIYRFPANSGSYLFLDNWLVCYAVT